MAPPPHHRRCHRISLARKIKAQRAAPFVYNKALQPPSRARFALRPLASRLVRPAKSDPPPPPLPAPLSPHLSWSKFSPSVETVPFQRHSTSRPLFSAARGQIMVGQSEVSTPRAFCLWLIGV